MKVNAFGYDPRPVRTRSDRQQRREAWCRSLGWGGSKAIEHRPHGTCPRCGSRLSVTVTHEDALFSHGGYGATRTTIRHGCPRCVWWTRPDVTETRPPR